MSKRSRRKGPASRDERRAKIKQKRVVVTEVEWTTMADAIERGENHPLLVHGVPVTVLPRP